MVVLLLLLLLLLLPITHIIIVVIVIIVARKLRFAHARYIALTLLCVLPKFSFPFALCPIIVVVLSREAS